MEAEPERISFANADRGRLLAGCFRVSRCLGTDGHRVQQFRVTDLSILRDQRRFEFNVFARSKRLVDGVLHHHCMAYA